MQLRNFQRFLSAPNIRNINAKESTYHRSGERDSRERVNCRSQAEQEDESEPQSKDE